MYDGKTQLPVANPLKRYLINSTMLPSLKRDKDGGLTLYLQEDSPGAAMESNWLPGSGRSHRSLSPLLLAEGISPGQQVDDGVAGEVEVDNAARACLVPIPVGSRLHSHSGRQKQARANSASFRGVDCAPIARNR